MSTATEVKRTAGPWHADGNACVIDESGLIVADCNAVRVPALDEWDDICRANARLIAASPLQHELLLALDEGTWESLGDWATKYGVELPAKWNEARTLAIETAIRKAKGAL